jgi:uncharacterized protein
MRCMTAERALTFDCQGNALFAILTEPALPSETGVVVVVGGPQYRVGSHRQFVLLARAIAQQGFAVLRFDVRGMGDSAGTPGGFEAVTQDIRSAVDALAAQVPRIKQVVLWGLCDGASAALLYADSARDPRICGLSLLNPWVRTADSLARVQLRHYYWRRLAERAFWTKLLSGRVGLAAWHGLMANLRARRPGEPVTDMPYQYRMARTWAAFEGAILLVLSGNDFTAKEFIDATRSEPAWSRALQHARLHRHDLPDADHTFTASAWRERVEQLTIAWLKALPAPRSHAFSEGA